MTLSDFDARQIARETHESSQVAELVDRIETRLETWLEKELDEFEAVTQERLDRVENEVLSANNAEQVMRDAQESGQVESDSIEHAAETKGALHRLESRHRDGERPVGVTMAAAPDEDTDQRTMSLATFYRWWRAALTGVESP